MDARLPLYLQVARTLAERIGSGAHPVGTLLPTENELAEQFGVSRHTVSQAIGHLRRMRLLSARKGIGTRVEAQTPQRAYYQTLQSLPDLFQFASDFVFRVVERQHIVARGALAAELGCSPGQPWLRLSGPREPTSDSAPLCWLTVLIDERYAAAVADTSLHATAIFALIERHFGIAITEVAQEIKATLLDAAMAEALGSSEGSAALLITRRYFGPGHRLIEMSKTLHPADRFRYAMTLRRDGG